MPKRKNFHRKDAKSAKNYTTFLAFSSKSNFYLCLRLVKNRRLRNGLVVEIYLLPLNGGCKSAGECQPDKNSQDNCFSTSGFTSTAHYSMASKYIYCDCNYPESAQWDALGKRAKRREGVVKWLLRPFRVFWWGIITGGFAPLYHGLSHFPSSGVKARIDYSWFFLLVIFADAQRQIQTYLPKAQAKDS